MVDLTPIKPWLETGSIISVGYAISTISRIGFDEWFKSQLEVFLNCSRTFSDGRRCTQTNDFRYAKELVTTVEMIKAYAEDKQDECYTKLLELHKANLEFEAVNGLEYSVKGDNKKKQSSVTKKRNKQTSLDIGDKPKKETAAERKLKAHAIKLNAVTFKPKSVSNGNTL